jgi:hypothetical protein
MKHIWNFNAGKSILLIVILIFLNNAAMAQVPTDTAKAKVDTTAAAMADTTKPAQTTAAATTATNESGEKPKHFIIYAGANSNQLAVPQISTMQIQALVTTLGSPGKRMVSFMGSLDLGITMLFTVLIVRQLPKTPRES